MPESASGRLKVLPAGRSPVAQSGSQVLNPRQRLERPLSLTTRLREHGGRYEGPCLRVAPAEPGGQRVRTKPGPQDGRPINEALRTSETARGGSYALVLASDALLEQWPLLEAWPTT